MKEWVNLFEEKHKRLNKRLQEKFVTNLQEDELDVKDEIVDGMARAMFVLSWAQQQEEKGDSFSGMDVMDEAPDTPDDAVYSASKLVEKIEKLNEIDNLGRYFVTELRYGEFEGEPTEFGHYLAMEALGTGVAWSDDHEIPHELKIPSWDYYWNGEERDNGMKADDYHSNVREEELPEGTNNNLLINDIEEMITAGESREDIIQQLVRGENLSEEESNLILRKAFENYKHKRRQ